jgi:ketosteroid isomerase-like protein
MLRRRRFSPWVPVLLSLVLASPALAQIDEPVVPLQTKQTELNRFRVEYAENFNKHDVAATLAMYAPDARVIIGNGQVFVGTEQIRGMLTQSVTEVPHLIIASDTMAIYGNTAIDIGTTTAHPAAGGEQVSRYIVVLRRDLKGWHLIRVAVTPVTGM